MSAQGISGVAIQGVGKSFSQWMRCRLFKASIQAWVSSHRFDKDTEQVFWRERYAETVTPLKTALLLGSYGFLAFLLLDLFRNSLSPSEVAGRSAIIIALYLLYRRLAREGEQESGRITARVATLAAMLSAADLTATLLVDCNPAFYAEAWPGLLPIYFVTYGQLVMPAVEAVLFGWLTGVVLPGAGWWIGVETPALLPSVIMLVIVNVFGMYTRCQLEAYSRKSFLARLSAEHSAEDKTRFLRHVSHNLRQPLQAISCYVSAMEAAISNGRSEDACRNIDRIARNVDELNESFNRILEITHLESGKQVPALAAVNLDALLGALEDQFSPMAQQRKLKLKVRRCRGEPIMVRSDANMLKQIIGNLVDNAIKYTDRGKVVLAAVKRGDGSIVVHVADTGKGIPAAQRNQIFKAGVRGGQREADGFIQGLGIGLEYVLKAVELMPGHAVDFSSEAGKGTDFRLQIPIAPEAKSRPDANVQVPQELHGEYILVVEDHEDSRKSLEDELRNLGCVVDTAASLQDLKRTFPDMLRRPDMLITDYYLGEGVTAPDVIEAVQDEFGTVPVLILSARGISLEDKAGLPAGAHILRKPARAAALIRAMVETMGEGERV
jgi:signal transduction histidine kinase